MDQQASIDQTEELIESSARPGRHPITLEHSPEETIKRMRSLPERAARFKEAVRALREANSR